MWYSALPNHVGKDYVSNSELDKLLLDAIKTGVVSNELAHTAGLIGQNLLKRYKFRGVDSNEGYGEAAYIILLKYKNYKASKGKAFNFLTTIIFNHFRGLYRTEQKQINLIEKAKEQIIQKNQQSKYSR